MIEAIVASTEAKTLYGSPLPNLAVTLVDSGSLAWSVTTGTAQTITATVIGAGAGSVNLATTYAAGSAAAHQTMTLTDADGGQIIVYNAGGFTGAYGLYILGTALRIYNAAAYLHATTANSSTATVDTVETVYHATSGTAAIGFGSKRLWQLDHGTGDSKVALDAWENRVSWKTVTPATAKWVHRGMYAAAMSDDLVTLYGDGGATAGAFIEIGNNTANVLSALYFKTAARTTRFELDNPTGVFAWVPNSGSQQARFGAVGAATYTDVYVDAIVWHAGSLGIGGAGTVSGANEGAIRYNESTQKFQTSTNGGAWTDFPTGGGGGGWTDDGAVVRLTDATDEVGIGTATASDAKLTIKGDSAQAGAVAIVPFNTSAGNTGELRFLELAANGAHYAALKAPDSIAANYVLTLPVDDGTAGQSLTTDGAGILTWTTIAGSSGGWTDDGTVVRLTTSTDDVSIGTASSLAKLAVVGDTTGQITVLIRSAPSQTVNILDVQNSGGTTYLSIDGDSGANAGFLRILGTGSAGARSGRIVVQTGATSSPSIQFEGDGNTGFYSAAADVFGVVTGGAERARWTTSGEIINGTSALGQLTVYSSAAGTKCAVFQMAASASANALEVQTSAAAVKMAVTPDGTIDISGITSTIANFKITKTTSTPVHTWGAGSETVKVNAVPNGYIKIDVAGSSRYIPFWT